MVRIAIPLLSKKNFPNNGKETTFTIAGSGCEALGDSEKKEKFLDISYNEADYRFILNWTNEQALGANGVSDTDDIHGGTITLWIDPKVEYKSKTEGGIRIKAVTFPKEE